MAFAAWACALPTAITDDSSLDGATAACRASNGQSSPGFWPSGAQACALPHRRRWAFLACEHLQISANGSRGLRLRFIGDDQETGGSYQLSFVSLDGDQGSPLSCDNSGCRVDSRRWSATLLSTSWVRFDARGLPKGLPATHMAQGRCWIDADTVSCESHSRNVAGMSAEAQL